MNYLNTLHTITTTRASIIETIIDIIICDTDPSTAGISLIEVNECVRNTSDVAQCADNSAPLYTVLIRKNIDIDQLLL